MPRVNRGQLPAGKGLGGPRVHRGDVDLVRAHGQHSVSSKLTDGTMIDALRLQAVLLMEESSSSYPVETTEVISSIQSTAAVSESTTIDDEAALQELADRFDLKEAMYPGLISGDDIYVPPEEDDVVEDTTISAAYAEILLSEDKYGGDPDEDESDSSSTSTTTTTTTTTPTSCFIGLTPVNTPKGVKLIKKMEVGDEVVTLHGEGVVEAITKDVRDDLITLLTTWGMVTCSPNHRFLLATGEWKEAQLLETGTLLGGGQEVVASRPYPGKHEVFNLTISPEPIYRVATLIVHNAKASGY